MPAAPLQHPLSVPVRLGRFLPSGRSLLVGFGLLGLVAGGYIAARQTSLFAVQRIEVVGSRPEVVRRVDTALAPLAGRSLLSLDAAAIDSQLEGLPDVRLVAYDRAFPHTARIVVSAERPVAVLRRGSDAWLVTERGRVLRRLTDPAGWALPRIWRADVAVPGGGALLTDEDALNPALALGTVLSADRDFFAGVAEARSADGELLLVLHSGVQVRLGDPVELALKVAVAKHVLAAVDGEAHYVDVSVPERAVVG